MKIRGKKYEKRRKLEELEKRSKANLKEKLALGSNNNFDDGSKLKPNSSA